MLLSVIIPIYNSEAWIEDCLNSILDQTMTIDEMEVVCVNDGSTDRTLDMLLEYKEKDARIRVFTKENGGLSSALNYGIERAQGQYAILINYDDYIDGRCFDKVITFMQDHDIDIFHGATQEVPFDSHYEKKYIDKDIEIIDNNSYAAPGDGGMTYYKTSLIKNCLWDEKAGACAEWLFYDAVSKNASNIVFSKYPTYYHRAVETSLGKVRTVKATEKRMASLLYLAEKYKNEFHYSVAYRMAVQSYLMDAMTLYSNEQLKKEILPNLKAKNLYPYKLIWRNWKPVRTASQLKLKLTLVNIAMFLFPWKWYYLLFAKIFRKRRKVESVREREAK